MPPISNRTILKGPSLKVVAIHPLPFGVTIIFESGVIMPMPQLKAYAPGFAASWLQSEMLSASAMAPSTTTIAPILP
jgi:hypothetical protein